MPWIDILAVFLGFCFVWQLTIVLRALDRFAAIPFLRPCRPTAEPAASARVSAVLGVLDDGERLREAVASLLEDGHENLEILLVERGSRAPTRAIAEELAAGDSRVRLLSATGTPAGWSHAAHTLRTALEEASGDVILLLSPRALMSPGSLAAILAFVHEEDLEHLVLLPRFALHSFWERAIEPHILQAVPFDWGAINAADQPHSFLPFTTCQVFRRGFPAAHDLFDELRGAPRVEFELIRQAARSAARSRAVAGPELVSVRQHSSLGELRRGWTSWFETLIRTRQRGHWRIRALLPLLALYYLSLATPWLALPVCVAWLVVAGWSTLIFTCALVALAACATNAMHRRLLTLQYGIDAELWTLLLQPITALIFASMVAGGCRRALARQSPGAPATAGEARDSGDGTPEEGCEKPSPSEGASSYTNEA